MVPRRPERERETVPVRSPFRNRSRWIGSPRRSNVQVAECTRGDAVGHAGRSDAAAAGRWALADAINGLFGVGARIDAARPETYRCPAAVQIARYPGPDEEVPPTDEGRGPPFRGYAAHQDNEVTPRGRANQRAVTAILYANAADWPDENGGHLVLYPRGADADGVPIAPVGGRLVLFDAFLWHQVKPAAEARYALTNWITRADF